MRSLLLGLAPAVPAILSLGATAAFAASPGGGHGEAHGIDPKALAFQLLNFGILLFILIKFAAPAINKALKGRHEQLKGDIEEAARLRAAAENRFQAHEKRLANLEREIAAMRDGIKQEAAHEQSRIEASALERARRIQDETRFQLEQQIKEAEIRFRHEMADMASRVAEELLRRSVTASDEQRLMQNFVAEVASPRVPGAVDGAKPSEHSLPRGEVAG